MTSNRWFSIAFSSDKKALSSIATVSSPEISFILFITLLALASSVYMVCVSPKSVGI